MKIEQIAVYLQSIFYLSIMFSRAKLGYDCRNQFNYIETR